MSHVPVLARALLVQEFLTTENAALPTEIVAGLVILIGSGTGAFAQAATKRPVYVIVERLTTTGPEDIQKRYGEISKSIVAKFGGRYLSRSQDNTLLEGPGPVACCMAIIEFPSSEAAQRWYASPEKSDGRKNPPEWGNIPHCDDPGFAPRKRPLVFANLIRLGQAVPGQPLRQEGSPTRSRPRSSGGSASASGRPSGSPQRRPCPGAHGISSLESPWQAGCLASFQTDVAGRRPGPRRRPC